LHRALRASSELDSSTFGNLPERVDIPAQHRAELFGRRMLGLDALRRKV